LIKKTKMTICSIEWNSGSIRKSKPFKILIGSGGLRDSKISNNNKSGQNKPPNVTLNYVKKSIVSEKHIKVLVSSSNVLNHLAIQPIHLG
jgi:hypothetical protein